LPKHTLRQSFASKENTARSLILNMAFIVRRVNMRKTILMLLILLLTVSLLGCTKGSAPNQGNSTQLQNDLPDKQTVGVSTDTSSIIYNNFQFGFAFTLPQSWQNYSIITTQWEGIAIVGQQSGKVVQSGPIVSIRHPQWTAAVPRQDIPIMIFTLNQWDSLQKAEFSVGAAPIPPSELGRNSRYVFALPARYNYAFPTGFEEVETILNGKPLQPTEELNKN
jgi:hypothetical protein